MENLFIVGFIFGLKHAVEADHFAAIVSLSTESSNTSHTIKIGLVWGLGHLTTLLLICGFVLILDIIISEKLAMTLEFLVGVMLILLGADVIRRIKKAGIKFHSQQHNGDDNHQHAHSYFGNNSPHYKIPSHTHSWMFPFRVFFVGLIHGIAGSAALLLLTLNSVESKTYGLVYILIFGLGSILGMGLLSGIISIPLQKTRRLDHTYNKLCMAAGLFTISIGINLIYEITQNNLFY